MFPIKKTFLAAAAACTILYGPVTQAAEIYIYPEDGNIKRGCELASEDSIEGFVLAYSPSEQQFYFRMTTSAEGNGGTHVNGFWLIPTDGPAPNDISNEVVMLYGDIANNVITAYSHDGNKTDDYYKSGEYLGTFAEPFKITEDAETGLRHVEAILDTSVLNRAFPDLSWKGLVLGPEKTGVWFHSVYDAQFTYDGAAQTAVTPKKDTVAVLGGGVDVDADADAGVTGSGAISVPAGTELIVQPGASVTAGETFTVPQEVPAGGTLDLGGGISVKAPENAAIPAGGEGTATISAGTGGTGSVVSDGNGGFVTDFTVTGGGSSSGGGSGTISGGTVTDGATVTTTTDIPAGETFTVTDDMVTGGVITGEGGGTVTITATSDIPAGTTMTVTGDTVTAGDSPASSSGGGSGTISGGTVTDGATVTTTTDIPAGETFTVTDDMVTGGVITGEGGGTVTITATSDIPAGTTMTVTGDTVTADGAGGETDIGSVSTEGGTLSEGATIVTGEEITAGETFTVTEDMVTSGTITGTVTATVTETVPAGTEMTVTDVSGDSATLTTVGTVTVTAGGSVSEGTVVVTTREYSESETFTFTQDIVSEGTVIGTATITFTVTVPAGTTLTVSATTDTEEGTVTITSGEDGETGTGGTLVTREGTSGNDTTGGGQTGQTGDDTGGSTDAPGGTVTVPGGGSIEEGTTFTVPEGGITGGEPYTVTPDQITTGGITEPVTIVSEGDLPEGTVIDLPEVPVEDTTDIGGEEEPVTVPLEGVSDGASGSEETTGGDAGTTGGTTGGGTTAGTPGTATPLSGGSPISNFEHSGSEGPHHDRGEGDTVKQTGGFAAIDTGTGGTTESTPGAGGEAAAASPFSTGGMSLNSLIGALADGDDPLQALEGEEAAQQGTGKFPALQPGQDVFAWCSLFDKITQLPGVGPLNVHTTAVTGNGEGFIDINTLELDCLSAFKLFVNTSSEVERITIQSDTGEPIDFQMVSLNTNDERKQFFVSNLDAADGQLFKYGHNAFKIVIYMTGEYTEEMEYDITIPRP